MSAGDANGSTGRRTPGLATRMLAAHVLVVLTGVLTAWVVAVAVGPALFREHLGRAGVAGEGSEVMHAERAFASATAIALSVALTAALAAAIAVSVLVTRRIARSVAAVSRAASDVAAGRLGARVPPPGLGAEFDDLVRSFNAMADRLDAVESTRRHMLADLAHELRTPTATLDGYLEAAQDGVRDLDEATLAMLRTQTHRLARLTQDIAAVSAAEEHSLHRARLDVATLIRGTVEGLQVVAVAKGVTLTADLPQRPLALIGDADRLGQVLANILDNALQHTPPGGRVSVSGEYRRGGILITVADTGDGIGPEHLPHVFERFYREDASRNRDSGGSGIGLTIARAIVEAHSGTITAASAGPGAGSTFEVWLPGGQ